MTSKVMKGNEKVHYLASTTFTIDRRYSDLKAIGKGSYGVVCSALDASTGKRMAIKKITPMAKHITDAKHVLREIRLMRHMGKHENIITLEDLIVRESADELYIVMELLDSDLHR
jgi:serine/threonine protein kinase